MEGVRNEIVPCRRVSSGEGEWFFGYYDNPAWGADDRQHLCTRAPFWLRLPSADDQAELGVLDLSSGAYRNIATTTAWNFQQGAMLQWHPTRPDREVIYNVRVEAGYRCAVTDVATGATRYLDAALATVDPLGRFGIGINFDRMFHFRPGYGYAGGTGAKMDEYHPADDGVWRVDLQSGRSSLILSLEQIWQFCGGHFGGREQKIVINHITCNTRGSRFVFLVRNFPSAEVPRWHTAILTAGSDGKDLRLLADFGYASHYHWRDERVVAFHCDGPEGPHLYEIDDQTGARTVLDRGFFLRDGHCSYSPDRAWMLYDSYPDAEGFRHLHLYSLRARRGMLLGSYHSAPACTGDFRCDLHPRWNRAGTVISFDGTHEGSRQIYTMETGPAMAKLR